LTQATGFGQRQPYTAGRNKITPVTCPARSQGVNQGVAGQGFEPWKASADGFTEQRPRRADQQLLIL
jgi:hypothetical protein